MIQEYLFTDFEKINDTNALCINGITPEIEKIENSNRTIVKYVMSGENEDSARELSAINDEIMEKYNPIVLSNESAAFFNKSLYPLFNEFERKLRKLLYLKSALSDKTVNTENINGLEKKDFGEIFTILFTDSTFVNDVKKTINDKSWQFTKKEILDMLQERSEHTLWDKLIGKDTIPLLCSNFIKVKNYRNDVMHAHNIGYKIYMEAQELINKINNNLDMEIGRIIGLKGLQNECNFNSLINEAIIANNLSNVTTESFINAAASGLAISSLGDTLSKLTAQPMYNAANEIAISAVSQSLINLTSSTICSARGFSSSCCISPTSTSCSAIIESTSSGCTSQIVQSIASTPAAAPLSGIFMSEQEQQESDQLTTNENNS